MSKKLYILIAVALGLTIIAAALAAPHIDKLLHPHNVTVLPAVVEYLETIPIENGTAIDWGSQPPGIYYYNYTVYNNTTYPLNITVTFEAFPWSDGFVISWTNSTHHSLNMSIIEPATSAIGDLTLVIPLGASGSYSWTHWLLIADATPP